MRFRFFTVALLLTSAFYVAKADTIAYVAPAGSVSGSNIYLGQNFVVRGSGQYTNITYNLFNGTTPYAPGTGFLFSSPFTGTGAQLSSSSAGYLGSAVGSQGIYSFDPSVALTAGTTYYFYENALIPQNSLFDNLAVSTETPYVSYGSTGFYPAQGSQNHTVFSYQVTGSPAAAGVTPEPSSLALLGTGLLGVAGIARRRFASNTNR